MLGEGSGTVFYSLSSVMSYLWTCTLIFFHILYHQVLLVGSDGETVAIVLVPASLQHAWQRNV